MYLSEDLLLNESVWCGFNEIFCKSTFYSKPSFAAPWQILRRFDDYDLKYNIILFTSETLLNSNVYWNSLLQSFQLYILVCSTCQ